MLCDAGYMYVFQKTLANDVQSWECLRRRKNTCRARVKVANNEIVDRVNDHTHAPNQIQVEVAKVKAAMKKRAETTLDDPDLIIAQCVNQSSNVEAVTVNLPTPKHVKRTIRR